MFKGSLYLYKTIIGRVITILDEVLFKLRVSFDGMVSRKKFFSESIRHIETHLDVVVEVLEFHSSVSFGLCPDKEFIQFW